ncbi:MAG: hypothetical protein ACRENK_08695 [Gemmatimonadaceae bacterium]
MRHALLSLGLPTLLLCGCGTDATQPGKRDPYEGYRTVALDFCSTSVPTFFAYRNDGQSWTTLSPDANGSFVFTAAPKVAIAFVRGTHAETFYTSAQNLQDVSGLTCQEVQGEKTLSGSVSNLGAGAYAVVTAGSSRAAGPGLFTLTSVPDGDLDLVAINRTDIGSPTDAIIRRNVLLPDGSSAPVFDFSSPEAVPLASNLLTVSGLLPRDFNNLFIAIRTANGTYQDWDHGIAYTGDTRTFRSIPSALLRDGDLHTLSFTARGDNFTSFRAEILSYHQPSDKSIVLGPKLNAATFTTLATTPYLMVRGTLPSQPEYGSAVRFLFDQATSAGGEHYWSVTGTARYFGGSAPSTWELEIPDLSAVAGFPASAGFETSQSTQANGEAWSSLLGLWIGRPPRDGEVVSYAGSPGTTIPAQ